MTIAPFGSWASPISEADLVKDRIILGGTAQEGDDTYWVEIRPQEAGRQVIVKRMADGLKQDILPPPFSARTTVHEYGGGAFLVHQAQVFFSNYSDQRIWHFAPQGKPLPLTPDEDSRYADYIMDEAGRRLIAIREDHSGLGQPVNELVAIPLDGSPITVLAHGYDFYASPRLNDQGQLAWICWNHPNMPWDHSELWTASLHADGLQDVLQVAGAKEESIFQPEWAPDGRLFFVSDRDEWWNLFAYDGEAVKPLHSKAAEFGLPQWMFGMSTYGFASLNRTITLYSEDGCWHLAGLDPKSGSLLNYRLPYSHLANLRVAGDRALMIAGAPDRETELVAINLTTGSFDVICRSSPTDPDPRYTSKPQTICFPSGQDQAYGFYYPPCNADFAAPDSDKPPLICIVHGGPTAATSSVFKAGIQYWTTRGFAVFDINHRGSSGYGRSFRNSLRGKWGIVDVADVTAGARFLASQGKADQNKLIIRGGSAGGYTTLACLTFHDTFRAGASYYGVSDLEVLAQETHKFESRYMDQLIGPWPQSAVLYRQRSPINFLENLDQPVVLLQGLEDKVVPPNQAETIFNALKEHGVPVAYVPFEGEQHGFRIAKNIIRAYQAELYFYAHVFRFKLPQELEPIQIFNPLS